MPGYVILSQGRHGIVRAFHQFDGSVTLDAFTEHKQTVFPLSPEELLALLASVSPELLREALQAHGAVLCASCGHARSIHAVYSLPAHCTMIDCQCRQYKETAP